MKTFFWWLVGLNCFDVLFTLLTIKYLGWVELNPMGLWPTLIIKTVGLISLGYLIYFTKYETKFVGFMLRFATLLYSVCTIGHLIRTSLLIV